MTRRVRAQGDAGAAQALVASASADPATLGAAVSLAQRALAQSALQAVSAVFSGRRRLAGDQVGTPPPPFPTGFLYKMCHMHPK